LITARIKISSSLERPLGSTDNYQLDRDLKDRLALLQNTESVPNLVGLGSRYLKKRIEEREAEKINLLVIGRASNIVGLESSLEVIERMEVATSEDLSKSIQELNIDSEAEKEEESNGKNGNDNYDLDSYADSVSYAESYADSSVNHSESSD
jgi:hypothetical protein